MIALLRVSLEAGDKGTAPALWMQLFSDSFFLSTVLFLGCLVLSLAFAFVFCRMR